MKNSLVLILLVLCCLCGLEAQTRVNSKRKKLELSSNQMTAIQTVIDSIEVNDASLFRENAISLRGYSKPGGAAKESFMLTNNTNLYISHVEIEFRYADVNGERFHERRVEIPCDLPPYSSKQFSIKSFDEGKRFYYKENKPRKGAVAYEISIKVSRYNVRVARD